MNIVWISPEGDGLALAFRLAQQKNKVYAAICRPYPGSEYLYKNIHVTIDGQEYFHIVSRSEIGSHIDARSLVVFDNNGLGTWADRLRQGRKYAVFGGGSFADKLEYDREFGLKVMQQCGIETPESHKFTDFKTAIEFVKKNPKRWVIKVSGEKLPSNATRVTDDAEHCIDSLEHMEKQFSGYPFELQEYLDGVTVEVEGWWNGEDWIKPFNLTFEKKKEATGDLGHNLGCATNVVCALPEGAPLAKGFDKLGKILRSHGYRGEISLNYIVSGGKPYGLEWTPRMGYDATFTLLDGCFNGYAQLLAGSATGRTQTMEVGADDFMVGVNFRYSPVDYSGTKPHTTSDGTVCPMLYPRGLAIGGVTYSNLSHFWFYDVQADKEGKPATAGVHGTLGCITYTDPAINVAAEKCYKALHDLEVDGLVYRTDAGNDIENRLKTLGELIKTPGKEVIEDSAQSKKLDDANVKLSIETTSPDVIVGVGAVTTG